MGKHKTKLKTIVSKQNICIERALVESHAVDSIRFVFLGFGYDSQTDDFKGLKFVTNYFEENLVEGLMGF
ncbi:hypothetical protein F3Y22_tig00111741pilonHSYRG00085 [Hibiscus syriacus]|uniref:Uncharacterized protein n=1 Tax=Hibiscus syriacus TaxID=106335 RepID=A0A6A2Y2H0_HIBSY|nr:hypothetical protein F3Y22_tig00111741pilonHSYRG00085 [Hibiscus syriacus]